MRDFTLGSLFDGSGGFPLAGTLHGIVPVWASEIEPFPIRVTKLRFPDMKHLGSVTDINGAEIDPVDIITFGSPCQDLSIAGKQAGIHDGERSNLFFEAVRIIKEMRNHDRETGRADIDLRPRFAVWENVPGAFSSNKGADFQAVLQALCEVQGGAAVSVPMPSKGKWTSAGCIVGNGWSVAWRVYDAQYWGVPQRRKRIYLVADFASEHAGEILFESEGVSGDSEQGREAGERAAEHVAGCSCGSGVDLYNGCLTGKPNIVCCQNTGRGWWKESDIATTLRTPSGGGDGAMNANVVCTIASTCVNAETTDGSISPTLLNRAGTGGNQLPIIVFPIDQHQQDGRFELLDETSPIPTGGNNTPMCLCAGNGQLHNITMQETSNTLDTMHDQQIVVYPGEFEQKHKKYMVRRLTPVECARLQGFPDWWCDGANGSDSAQYKMWGNGIALPCAADVIGRLKKALEGEK